MSKKDLAEAPNNKRIIWMLLVVILILTTTNVIAFSLNDQQEKRPLKEKDSKYSLLNPAREFINQRDLIINVQPVRDYLNDKYEKDSRVSAYFEYLPTGANISINKDAEFYPASLLKVPIAMAVAKKVEKGEWKWDNKLVLMATDKDDKFGTLYKEPTGSVFTIEELVKRSLKESDNTAHFILTRNLELEEIDDVYSHMGLKGFLSTNGYISAKRYSVIFRALYNSSYLSEDSSQKIISLMTETDFNKYIKKGLPESVVFSHKIGIDTDKHVYLDSGIIYAGDRSYLLTVAIQTKDEQFVEDTIKDISEKVYNYINNYTE